MNIQIPNNLVVFRRVHANGNKGQWHIHVGASSNGFTAHTHPTFPLWWGSQSHKAVCGAREDERQNSHGFTFDGRLEFSTLGEVNKICPACMPILKQYPELSELAK